MAKIANIEFPDEFCSEGMNIGNVIDDVIDSFVEMSNDSDFDRTFAEFNDAQKGAFLGCCAMDPSVPYKYLDKALKGETYSDDVRPQLVSASAQYLGNVHGEVEPEVVERLVYLANGIDDPAKRKIAKDTAIAAIDRIYICDHEQNRAFVDMVKSGITYDQASSLRLKKKEVGEESRENMPAVGFARIGLTK